MLICWAGPCALVIDRPVRWVIDGSDENLWLWDKPSINIGPPQPSSSVSLLSFTAVLPYFPSLNMSACPRQSNANVHPAQALLNSTTKGCTPAQVKADNEEAAVASTSAAKVEAQSQNEKSVCVTQLKDSAWVIDVANKWQAICSDFHMSVSEKQVCYQ